MPEPFVESYNKRIKFTNPRKYTDGKIKFLTELGIALTSKERVYLYGLRTEHQIDAAVKQIMLNRWDD